LPEFCKKLKIPGDETISHEIFEKVFDGVFGKSSYLPADRVSLVIDNQCGDGNHSMTAGKLSLFVYIYLANLDFSLIFTGKLIDEGTYHLAGAAPGSPKINQNRHGGIDNFRLKIIVC
jgi:hypothetical protein